MTRTNNGAGLGDIPIELNQTMGGEAGVDHYLMSTSLGFTFAASQYATVITGATLDLFGKNESQNFGGFFAVTLAL